MDGILYWLAVGAAGLLFVAAVVAWWEHLGRVAAAPGDALVGPPAQAPGMDVDVDVDKPAIGDVAVRREALDSALERMTQPGALSVDRRRGWTDTTPMVGPGALKPQVSDSAATASSRQG